MAEDSLVTEAAVTALANAINTGKAGKSELEAIANAVDALQAQVDAMPNLVVVPDPALAPAGSIAVVVAP